MNYITLTKCCHAKPFTTFEKTYCSKCSKHITDWTMTYQQPIKRRGGRFAKNRTYEDLKMSFLVGTAFVLGFVLGGMMI